MPWPRLSRELSFWRAKLDQAARRRIDPSLTRDPNTLRTLRRDGVAFIPNLLSPAEVGAIRDEVAARTDLMDGRRGEGIVKRNARYLLLDPERRVPATAAFFRHPRVTGLARAYLSRDAVLERPAIQLKVDVGAPCIVDYFHIDEWRYLLSGFLFLTDVGEAEAPMIYLKGSHRPSRWRVGKEREFFHYYERRADGEYGNEESAYCGCFLPPEARRIQERHGYLPVLCTGQAGTLMLFDNLGLHRATPLRANHRLVLSGYWLLPRREAKRGTARPASKARGALNGEG